MPVVKIRTTDGPALAATSMIADDSSSVTGCLTVAEFGFWDARRRAAVSGRARRWRSGR